MNFKLLSQFATSDYKDLYENHSQSKTIIKQVAM
jgi:hypothetical protein